MSTVLTHATIYTGEQEVPVIKDAYIRFDKQIEAMGPMSELVVTSALWKALSTAFFVFL